MAKPGCIFCAIVAGELDAEVVLEGEDVVAFLDHRPLFPGHVLIVPRCHHETIEDLPEQLIEPFFAAGRRMAGAVRRAMDAQGTFMAVNNVVSQSVPHLHLHVVPRSRKDGLRGFFWPRNPYQGPEEMHAAAKAIRAELEGKAS